MPVRFGYLNQNNPLTIGDMEAQVMENCAIERGFIEYKDYAGFLTGSVSDNPELLASKSVLLPNGFTVGAGIGISNGKLMAGKKNNGVYSWTSTFESVSKITNFTVTKKKRPILHEGVDTTGTGIRGNKRGGGGAYSTLADIETAYGEKGLNNLLVEFFGNFVFSSGDKYKEISLKRGVTGGTATLLVTDATKANLRLWSDLDVVESWDLTGDSEKVLITFKDNAEDTLKALNGGTLASSYDLVFYYLPLPEDTLTYNPNGVKHYLPVETDESMTVFYAATLIDNTSTSATYLAESAPEFADVYIDPFYEYVEINATIPSGYSAQFYRIPFGGEEYLTFTNAHNITNYVTVLPFADNTPDTELGYTNMAGRSMLITDGDTRKVLTDTSSSFPIVCVALHNDCLFIGKENYVYWSRTNEYSEFPAEQFFYFPDNIVGFCSFYSNLAIWTTKEIYILYGADTESYILRKVDYKSVYNHLLCQRSIYNRMLALASYTNVTKIDEVILSNSQYAYNIGLRVKDFLASINSTNILTNLKNGVLENRYYVVCVTSKYALVYDVLSDGFCLADLDYITSQNKRFKYRTKEFLIKGSQTGGAQYHKGMWVRGKGAFKVRFYGDNKKISNYQDGVVYDNSEKIRTEQVRQTGEQNTVKTYYFNIRPDRYVTFSIEFEGDETAQIHDWGIC